MAEGSVGRRGVVVPVVALLALAGPGSPCQSARVGAGPAGAGSAGAGPANLGPAGAGAVSRVTQVIDGLPQVIAPQQIIVSCDPAVLPVLCSNALALVRATIISTGQAAFNLVRLPNGVSLQGALATLRAATRIPSAQPNPILIGSATYPQTWHFPARGAPRHSRLPFA